VKIVKKNLVVEIANIRTNLFVRKALDANRKKHFEDLVGEIVALQNQGKTPDSQLLENVRPMLVTPAYEVLGNGKLRYLPDTPYYEGVDGRHRHWAWTAHGVKETTVMVAEYETYIELISEASKANLGGSMPPTPEDRKHTVRTLVQAGASQREVAEAIGFTIGMARRMVEQAKAEINRARLIDALDEYRLGNTPLPQIAAKHRVDEDKLRELLGVSSRKGKKKLKELHTQLTATAKGNAARRSKLFASLMDKYQDREVTVKQLRQVFKHLHDTLARQEKHVKEWESRFESLIRGGNGAQSEKRESA